MAGPGSGTASAVGEVNDYGTGYATAISSRGTYVAAIDAVGNGTGFWVSTGDGRRRTVPNVAGATRMPTAAITETGYILGGGDCGNALTGIYIYRIDWASPQCIGETVSTVTPPGRQLYSLFPTDVTPAGIGVGWYVLDSPNTVTNYHTWIYNAQSGSVRTMPEPTSGPHSGHGYIPAQVSEAGEIAITSFSPNGPCGNFIAVYDMRDSTFDFFDTQFPVCSQGISPNGNYVVGEATLTCGSQRCTGAFVFDRANQRLKTVTDPDPTWQMAAEDAADNGVVAGRRYYGYQSEPFSWDGRSTAVSLLPLDRQSCCFASANAISNSGVIAGFQRLNGVDHVRTWSVFPPLRCAAPTSGETATNNSVARLYRAYFQRDADQGGLNYWVPRYRSGELCLTDISNYFAQSDEFRSKYGSLDNPNFVRRVYLNVLGREPDPDGYNYWAGQITYGGMSRGTMMVGFSESPEFRSRSGLP